MAEPAIRDNPGTMSDPCTILVVDDEPDLETLIRQRFRRRIRKGELSFVFAHDGIGALEALEDHEDIELIMTDINMPRMDGLTLLNELRAVRPRVRAVVVSAYGDMQNIRTAMNRGAFDFVTKPIDFKDLELTIEKTLTHLAALREALKHRTELLAIKEELRVARDMQISILPQRFPATRSSETHALMIPAKEVGGDFYDVFHLRAERIGVVMADVSGKGVPAALFMMVSRTLVKGHAVSALSPGVALTQVNNLLGEENESAMFVTLVFGILDSESGSFTYANAGHCAPYLLRAGEKPRELPLTQGIALGAAPDVPYSEGSTRLEPGDRIFLYTDGVPEAESPDEQLFGNERLEAVLEAVGARSPEAINRAVVDAVREFSGGEHQSDDITCLTLAYHG